MTSKKYAVRKLEDVTESKHPEPEYLGTVFRLIGKDLGARFFAINMATLKPGQKIPIHSHPTAEEVHVLVSGESTLTIEGEKVHAEAVSAFLYPPGLHYGLINESKRDATWIFIGAPIDEYLETYRKLALKSRRRARR